MSGRARFRTPWLREGSRCHKTKKAKKLRWRLNNWAEACSNQTLKLHLPGERPGPGSGEDSPTEDPPQPPTASRIASASQLRRRKLFAQPQLPSPMRTSSPQISPPRSLGVLRTGSEPLNCFACHLVTVATPSGGARRSNRSLRPLSSLSQGGDRDAARDGEGVGPALISGAAQATQSPGCQSSSREVGWQAKPAGRVGGSDSRLRGGEGG